jgi:hypothetical protein
MLFTFKMLRNFQRWPFRGRLKNINIRSYRRLRDYAGLEHNKVYPSQEPAQRRRDYDRWLSQS